MNRQRIGRVTPRSVRWPRPLSTADPTTARCPWGTRRCSSAGLAEARPMGSARCQDQGSADGSSGAERVGPAGPASRGRAAPQGRLHRACSPRGQLTVFWAGTSAASGRSRTRAVIDRPLCAFHASVHAVGCGGLAEGQRRVDTWLRHRLTPGATDMLIVGCSPEHPGSDAATRLEALCALSCRRRRRAPTSTHYSHSGLALVLLA